MKSRKRLTGTPFTVVLIFLTAAESLLTWYLLTYFPIKWGWSIATDRTGGDGSVQSAFAIFSLITGGLTGLWITEKINRGWENGRGISLFLTPLLTAVLSIATVRVVQVNAGIPTEAKSVQNSLVGLWILYFFTVQFHFLRLWKKKSR